MAESYLNQGLEVHRHISLDGSSSSPHGSHGGQTSAECAFSYAVRFILANTLPHIGTSNSHAHKQKSNFRLDE